MKHNWFLLHSQPQSGTGRVLFNSQHLTGTQAHHTHRHTGRHAHHQPVTPTQHTAPTTHTPGMRSSSGFRTVNGFTTVVGPPAGAASPAGAGGAGGDGAGSVNGRETRTPGPGRSLMGLQRKAKTQIPSRHIWTQIPRKGVWKSQREQVDTGEVPMPDKTRGETRFDFLIFSISFELQRSKPAMADAHFASHAPRS